VALGEKLRSARQAKGWSQERLAEEVAKTGIGSIGVSTIAKIEQGRYPLPKRGSTDGYRLEAVLKPLGLDLIDVLAECRDEEIEGSVFGGRLWEVRERRNAGRPDVSARLADTIGRESHPAAQVLAKDGRLDSFLKGLELLRDPNPTVVVGASELFRMVAAESDSNRLAVSHLLSAYIRHRSQTLPPWDSRAGSPPEFPNVLRTLSDLGPHATYGPQRIDLTGANLSYLVLWKHNLRGVVLAEARCVETHFDGAELSVASFYRTDLTRATFGGAKLDQAKFELAILTDTDLRHTDLGTVRSLTRDQLLQSVYDSTTQLPALI
jgi:transcriptional regulator with XRE-family HTH domain